VGSIPSTPTAKSRAVLEVFSRQKKELD